MDCSKNVRTSLLQGAARFQPTLAPSAGSFEHLPETSALEIYLRILDITSNIFFST